MGTSFEEIWSRVTSGADDGLTDVRRRIRREAEIRRLCQAQLRTRLGPAPRETLILLERHAAGRLRQLQTLHFLIGGGTFKPQETPLEPGPLPRTLREIYRRLSESAVVNPEDTARLGPDAAALLRQTAEEARTDAAPLRRLAEKLL